MQAWVAGQGGGRAKVRKNKKLCRICCLESEGLVLGVMVDLSLLTPAQKHMLPFTAA